MAKASDSQPAKIINKNNVECDTILDSKCVQEKIIFLEYNFKLFGPFIWMGFNCLKATEPLRGGSLLFTTKFPEIPGTHLIDLGRMIK